MKVLNAGYNISERESIEEGKYERFEEMSVLQFLRKVKRRESIPSKITILGLDLLLLEEGMDRYVRKVLSNASDHFFRRNPVIQFIVEELVMNLEPKVRVDNKEVRLTPIFGNRLTQEDVDWYYSPFNI